jgi:hypothetical protein
MAEANQHAKAMPMIWMKAIPVRGKVSELWFRKLAFFLPIPTPIKIDAFEATRS